MVAVAGDSTSCGVGSCGHWNAGLSFVRARASCSASTSSSSTRQQLSLHAIQQSSSLIIYPSKTC
eukprot:11707726-Alexandrium_andersonii.AAC.1